MTNRYRYCLRCKAWYALRDGHECPPLSVAKVDTIKPIMFVIDGHPIPKKRARKGKDGKVYTPVATRNWERTIAQYGKIGMMQRDKLTGDCRLSCTFYRNGKRRADLSNLIKSVEDGLNGIAWADDTQITEYGAMKIIYEATEPRVTVTIEAVAA